MNDTEKNIEIEYNGELLRLSVRQLQQLFDLIFSERDTCAYQMLQLFKDTAAKENNERRIREANFQERHQEEVMRKDAG